MPSTQDYLGTLALNLRAAAQVAEDMREDQTILDMVGQTRTVSIAVTLEQEVINFRSEISEAYTKAYKSAKAKAGG